jgi:ADP-heptose:LPS heptosyltransferase
MGTRVRDTIKNYWLLVVCFLYAVVRGSAKKIKLPVADILIVHEAKMGDMVCITPMIRAIKKTYPQARIFVFGSAVGEAILAGNPALAGYIRSDQNMFDLIKSISEKRIQCAVVAAPDFRSAALCFLAGVRTIVCSKIEGGFSPWETIPYRLIKKLTLSRPLRMNFYTPREYLNLLEPLGIRSGDTAKELYYSVQAAERIKQFFADNQLSKKDPIVAISPSVGNKIKKWPEERFAELAAWAHKYYRAAIVVIGGPVDVPEVTSMLESVRPDIPIINTLNQFSIDELKAFLSKVSLLIAVDTGPIYIAEAFGVPTIDIIGPVSEKEQPPISDIHKIVFLADRKEPVVHLMNARVYDYAEARRQVEGITIAMVTDAFDDLARRRGWQKTSH